jgi:hypothetical protein
MPTANEALFDASISHQIYLQRLSTGTVREILDVLTQSEAGIVERLLREDLTEFTQSRLKGLLAEIRKLNHAAYEVLQENLTGQLSDIAEHESNFQAGLIEKVLPIEFTLIRPSIEILASIINNKPLQGRFIADEVKDLDAIRIKQIEQALRIGVLEGKTTSEIVRSLRGTKSLNYKDGILQRSRNDVERLVRTSITHVTVRARDELYSRNTEVIKQWRFVATLDSRTSKICIALDGTVYDIGTGSMPPRHPNCRSTTSPILKSWQEMGLNISELPASTRATMDGQVPENITYQQWLKKKPREFVEDVLGKTKAKLFLDGNMSVDKFFDATGKEYTLPELKKRDNSIFATLQI